MISQSTLRELGALCNALDEKRSKLRPSRGVYRFNLETLRFFDFGSTWKLTDGNTEQWWGKTSGWIPEEATEEEALVIIFRQIREGLEDPNGLHAGERESIEKLKAWRKSKGLE